ncbi:unnamed protein product, partial [Rotaria sp. Silwood2]
EQICPKLVEHIKKKSKAAAAENLKPMQVENHFFICVSCLIEYAEFESQAKQNKLATEGKHFCSTFPLKDDKKFFLKMNANVAGLGVIGRDRYDVYPLKGKILNVREALN